MLDVSARSVRDAKAVINRGAPELVAAVEAGEISVRKAAESVRQPATESESTETSKPKREPPFRGVHAPMSDFRACLHRFCNTPYFRNGKVTALDAVSRLALRDELEDVIAALGVGDL
jgi:hypothetical protein